MTPSRGIKRNIDLATPGQHTVQYRTAGRGQWIELETFDVHLADPDITNVALVPSAGANSAQRQLWEFIDDVTDDLRFRNFAQAFEDERYVPLRGPLGAQGPQSLRTATGGPDNPAYGTPTYRHLHRISTEFVNDRAIGGNRPEAGLSYVARQSRNERTAPYPDPVENSEYPLAGVPFVELIYVYWIEEAMVFQSLNHIIARFQNRRVGRDPGPLARFAVSPLLPLRGLLWGLSEAERERLSVRRRDNEYGYEYGLHLVGRAVPPPEMAVERRTQFLPAFHSLLNAAHHYYKERDDLTIQADAFPLLNSLRELHLVLARGANNQFADLPLTARIETIDVQWTLAQPEMRHFLGGPTMVPYEEPWMDRVDTMKQLFGWSDASVSHFFDLAFHGERLVLSVRHGDWNAAGMTGADAENWAMHWRNSVQRYIHAYRAVTGVDLAERVDTTMPSTLLSRRLAKQFA